MSKNALLPNLRTPGSFSDSNSQMLQSNTLINILAEQHAGLKKSFSKDSGLKAKKVQMENIAQLIFKNRHFLYEKALRQEKNTPDTISFFTKLIIDQFKAKGFSLDDVNNNKEAVRYFQSSPRLALVLKNYHREKLKINHGKKNQHPEKENVTRHKRLN